MFTLPSDYEERVYAGVLGKIIGVYLGRPFEGWSNQKIEAELGEIWYYVHEKRGVPLIVTDDDISGTFTFLRAFPDFGNPYEVTPEQVGKTWLNYLIEDRTVLWWGGMGTSTEHTAYLRLKAGIHPPHSGSIEMNGPVVAEQIGAQIFIDGWAMVCPGDPEKAATLARAAASVSHDGEAIYGAQVIAAMESLAFVESSIDTLLDTAVTFIPRASTIYQLIADLRQWKFDEPRDWRKTLRKVEEKYGYDTFGGGCHMVPNHAVIILALLYGDDDFQKSLMIANTAGWDTDCNSGNVGCLMGIKNGLAGINRSADFRGPVADRLYVASADGGRCVTDAPSVTYQIVNIGRALQGQRPLAPNNATRFHFTLPGSVHGFTEENSTECRGTTRLENGMLGHLAEGTGAAADERALIIRYFSVAPGRHARVSSPTFLSPEALQMPGYSLMASPTLYPGQLVRARIVADDKNGRPAPVCLYLRCYGPDDKLVIVRSPLQALEPGESYNLTWQIPDLGGQPIAEIGVEIGGHAGSGAVYLDWLGWSGMPTLELGVPANAGRGLAWRRAWINATDRFESWGCAPHMAYRIIQDEGTGLALQGCPEWTGYTVSTDVYAHLADGIGLVAAARGLRRYVTITLSPDGAARLILVHDDEKTVLAETSILWELYKSYHLSLSVHADGTVSATVDDGSVPRFLDGAVVPEQAQGAVGLLATVGNCHFGPVRVEPA